MISLFVLSSYLFFFYKDSQIPPGFLNCAEPFGAVTFQQHWGFCQGRRRHAATTHQEPGQSFPGSVSCGSHQCHHAPFWIASCGTEFQSWHGETKPECRSEYLLEYSGILAWLAVPERGTVQSVRARPRGTFSQMKRSQWMNKHPNVFLGGWAIRSLCGFSWSDFIVKNRWDKSKWLHLLQPVEQRFCKHQWAQASLFRQHFFSCLIATQLLFLLKEILWFYQFWIKFPSLNIVESQSHLTCQY